MDTLVQIPTQTWNALLDRLKKHNWKVKYRYDGFDAGIDFDLIILRKKSDILFMGWTNWFEGEVQAEAACLKEVEQIIGQVFPRGKAEALKPEVLALYKRYIRS